MEVNGHIYTPADLPQQKEPPGLHTCFFETENTIFWTQTRFWINLLSHVKQPPLYLLSHVKQPPLYLLSHVKQPPLYLLSHVMLPPTCFFKEKLSIKTYNFVYFDCLLHYWLQRIAVNPCPTCEQLDHPLSAVRDCLFIQHTDSYSTKADCSIHNLRTPSAMVTGTL